MKTRFYVGLTGIIAQIVAILIMALISIASSISRDSFMLISGGIVLLGLNILFVILMISGME